MGGDHGLALQQSPDPSHEGSAMVALVRGSVGVGVPGPCLIVAANLLTNRFTQVRVALALFFVNVTKGKGQVIGSSTRP